MLERIVHDQIFDFLLKNNVITRNQSAFRKQYSTITSLIRSTDQRYENIENKKMNLAIFLGLKQEFDTVDHKTLVEKLMVYRTLLRTGFSPFQIIGSNSVLQMGKDQEQMR